MCIPAQIESARWWRSPHFTDGLSLRPWQKAEIERIYRETWAPLRARTKEAEAARAVLDRMIAEDGPDIVLERIVIEAEQADAARWRTRTLMLCRIFRVLSPAQRVQLRGMVGERLVASAHVD